MNEQANSAEVTRHPLAGEALSGADTVIQVLADEGVDTIFGYSGGAILPIYDAIRTTYDGPLDIATDFMVWNVTTDGIRSRMAVPNHESFPAPIQRVNKPSTKPLPWSSFSLRGVEL